MDERHDDETTADPTSEDPPTSTIPTELSEEFDAAFAELSAARIAYEDDPRDPDNVARLGAARDRLEAARKAIDAARVELGERPQSNPDRPFSKVDGGDGLGLWASIQHEG